MKRSSKELKRLARENLTGHYNIPMGAFVVAGAITLAIELPFSMLQNTHNAPIQSVVFYIAEFLISLIGAVLSVGQIKIHLSMARKQPYELKQLFYGFKNHSDRIILSALLLTVITVITSIPSVIGTYLIRNSLTVENILIFSCLALVSLIINVLIGLFLQLVYYLILDRPDMNVLACFKTSCQLMKGQKGRLFYLLLSFIGMDILVLLSLGIGSLWIMPYQSQTFALFYLDIIDGIPASNNSYDAPNPESNHSFNQYV